MECMPCYRKHLNAYHLRSFFFFAICAGFVHGRSLVGLYAWAIDYKRWSFDLALSWQYLLFVSCIPSPLAFCCAEARTPPFTVDRPLCGHCHANGDKSLGVV